MTSPLLPSKLHCLNPLSLPYQISQRYLVLRLMHDLGVRVILLQEQHLLAFISKALGPKSIGLSTYDKEYLAILMEVQ